MQSRRTAIAAGCIVAALAAGGVTSCSVFGGGTDGTAAAPATGEVSGDAAVSTAEAFLNAWADGDTEAAAALTDDPAAAREALDAFADDAGLTSLSLTAAAPSGGRVPFIAQARIGHGDASASWSYDSALRVGRDADGASVVAWEPAVLYPGLTAGQRLETGPEGQAPPVRAVDREGAELTAAEYPGLAAVLDGLGERYGAAVGGEPAVELRVVDSAGERVKHLMRLTAPTPGEVPTTIDPAVQNAAEAAMAGTAHGALVAIRPSTGEILAVVNAPADGDLALEGALAPGSTWKIVTSSMLIDSGLASAYDQHPCPKYYEHGGWRFQNLNEFEINGGTFMDSFTASCNTAFISAAPRLSDTQLGAYARDHFGIGLDWKVGVDTVDGFVPVETKAQMAAQLIGQAGVRTNPMVMASVSATVRTGVFRQPYLVPPSFDGRALAQAGGLPAGTAGQLRELMHGTAAWGSGAAAMSGLEGTVGAKTGSAEVIDQDTPDAWFTAYRDDLAVAAVVPESGHGGKIAGPLVAEVLRTAS